ncbi:MAG TPA: hypothetical protein VFR09_06695 [Alphaproteobacteria bacterium]|nr:hypothetical protein [Alphaproteobacteria bacterium]
MLTPDELLAAFESHRRATPGFMPQGTLLDCVPTANNAILVTMQMPPGSGQTKGEFLYKNDDAVKPLIRFCLEHGIMLPRDGQKTLYIKDGVASLYVVLNVTIDVSEHLPQQRADRSHPFMPADIAIQPTAAR